MDHAHVDAVTHTYLDQSTAGWRTLLRHPPSSVAAERQVRRLHLGLAPHRVLIHREVSPLSGGSLERRLAAAASFCVYDFDDAMQWDWGERGQLRSLIPKAHKTIAMTHQADRVIAGSVELLEWASAWAREVVYIPSCIDPGSYPSKSSYGLSDPPRLGWIGSPATEHYLRLVTPALLEIHRRTGARLTVVSAGHRSLGPLDAMTDRVVWSEEAVQSLLPTWDAGIMPLLDGVYERGKCGYKLLQYGAAALPAIGSGVGVNQQLLALMGGQAPTSVADWTDAVMAVLDAPEDTRRTTGVQSKESVTRHYSYAAWKDAWRNAVGED